MTSVREGSREREKDPGRGMKIQEEEGCKENCCSKDLEKEREGQLACTKD